MPAAGLELASIHSVAVVIVDYCMPEMNGQEVAIEMRRLRSRAPIIMLSGAVDIPEQALKWVDAFIAKDCWAASCGLRSHNSRDQPLSLRVTHNGGGAVYEGRVGRKPETARLSR